MRGETETPCVIAKTENSHSRGVAVQVFNRNFRTRLMTSRMPFVPDWLQPRDQLH